MLQEYIGQAMDTAEYEIMEDGRFFGHVTALPGAWAEAATLEACRRELQEVVEDIILLSVRERQPLPVLGGIDINEKATVDAS
jgi:predicted RNase H-like HicB family nuclease